MDAQRVTNTNKAGLKGDDEGKKVSKIKRQLWHFDGGFQEAKNPTVTRQI